MNKIDPLEMSTVLHARLHVDPLRPFNKDCLTPIRPDYSGHSFCERTAVVGAFCAATN